jgi:hypothetical protein
MDITSAKSAEEKKLDKEISDLFSKINALVVEKRKLTNFDTMPIKKKPVSEKEKLQAKTIDQLKRYAKKVGAKIVTPDGKAKTKEQLINSVIMKQRLSGMAAAQTGTSNKARDSVRKAKAPGKRTSASGRVYSERRKNRSDVPGTMQENDNGKILNVAQEIYKQLGGRKFSVMTGAKNYVDGGNFLSFKLPSNFAKNGINYIKITLTPLDLYDMELGRIRAGKYSVYKVKKGLYNDMLRSTFTSETGLNTIL